MVKGCHDHLLLGTFLCLGTNFFPVEINACGPLTCDGRIDRKIPVAHAYNTAVHSLPQICIIAASLNVPHIKCFVIYCIS